MAVGRISGPLLKDNLLRNGVNLAFETSLLYLDVVNSRVGINTTTPSNELQVNGTTRTTNLYVSGLNTLGNVTFSGNTISTTSGNLILSPSGSNSVVYQNTISTGTNGLRLSTNVIGSDTNTNIEITPNGTGVVNINSNTTVNGNLHVTGNITADGGASGNIQLGNQTTDTISFTGEVNSDILPSATNTYNLGSSSLRWANLYANTMTIPSLNVASADITDFQTSGIDITNNTISPKNVDTNLNLNTSGNGIVAIGNLRLANNTINNATIDAITQFNELGTGYVKVSGTNGMVIPVGTNGNRPVVAEFGMVRYNSDLQYVEMYVGGQGTGWENVAGQAAGVTQIDATDLSIVYAVIFG